MKQEVKAKKEKKKKVRKKRETSKEERKSTQPKRRWLGLYRILYYKRERERERERDKKLCETPFRFGALAQNGVMYNR
jgi:hypothetical protein